MKMKSQDRIVVQTPLEESWDDNGVISIKHLRYLNVRDIKGFLQKGKVDFVVIDVGLKPK